MSKTHFVKFFSGVQGKLVSRYGSARAKTGPLVIGGVREVLTHPDPGKPLDLFARGAGNVTIDESIIVALTEAEWTRYWREYTRALKDGALRERSEDEYLAANASPQQVKE